MYGCRYIAELPKCSQTFYLSFLNRQSLEWINLNLHGTYTPLALSEKLVWGQGGIQEQSESKTTEIGLKLKQQLKASL